MKIWQEGSKIHLQLADLTPYGVQMLFDITIDAKRYNELKAHMIEHLNAFHPEEVPHP